MSTFFLIFLKNLKFLFFWGETLKKGFFSQKNDKKVQVYLPEIE